jgi:hypothetical protein
MNPEDEDNVPDPNSANDAGDGDAGGDTGGDNASDAGGSAGEGDAGSDEGSEESSAVAPAAKPKAQQDDEGQDIAGIIDRTTRAYEERMRRQTEDVEERARVAQMTPQEKVAYDQKKEIEQLKRERLQDRIATAEQLDKMAIKGDSKLGNFYKKYEKEVEAKIKEERARGNMVNREAVLRYHIGGLVIDSQKVGGPSRQKNQGAENIKKSTSKPTSGKGQVRIVGGKSHTEKQARAERLANVRI